MISRSYFGKMNSILGSVVPLAMFTSSAFRHNVLYKHEVNVVPKRILINGGAYQSVAPALI